MNEEVKVLDMTHADEVIREVEGGVAPTMQSRMGTGGNQVPLVMEPHAVAVRTANTHANGHGVADEATHTLDRASGQAVCAGVDTYNQSISQNVMHTLHHHDGLDNQPKVCVEATGLTMTLDRFHQTGVEEVANTLRTSSAQGDNAPTIRIGAYNQSATEESCMTLRSAMTGTDGNDADPKVVTNGVATMLKVRCGKDTYTKPDGSTGTAGKGPLASEESAFTLAATQDQTLIQQANTILEDNHANATKTNPGEILRVLREALGEKAFEEWEARISAPIWTKEVLRHKVHGEGVQGEAAKAKCQLVNDASSSEGDRSAGAMRDVRQAECDGCPPQGWGLPQQHPGESDSPVPQLSHQGSPQAEGVQDLWRTDEGARVLREALSALQEIRRSASVEAQSIRPFALRHIVRRLTPTEAERLQAFPDGWTRIPYRGKPAEECPDSPRYKALGNSMSTNCVEWILRRIVAAVRLGMIGGQE